MKTTVKIHKKLNNLFFKVVGEPFKSIIGSLRPFQILEILQKYELVWIRLLDVVWISFLPPDLVDALLKVM